MTTEQQILSLTEDGLSALQIAQRTGVYPERVRAIQQEAGVRSRYVRELPVEIMREAWDAGCWDAEIARRAEVAACTVKRWREAEGLQAHLYEPQQHTGRAGKNWDQKEARRLYDLGASDARIASAVGVSNTTVRKWRSAAGLPANHRRPVEDGDIARLHSEGLNDRQIGRRLGVSESVPRRWREQKGLPPNIDTLDEEEARRLYDAGLVDREIAEQLGVTRIMVNNWRHREGLRANGGQGMDKEAARQMWEAGASDGAIARTLGVTSGAVRNWRVRNGLEANYPSGRKT